MPIPDNKEKSLDDILEGMLSDVQMAKRKKKSQKNKHLQPVATAHSPKVWEDEALILLCTEITCSNCGNSSISWEDHLRVVRRSTRTKSPITMMERIGNEHYAAAYGGLRKRVEFRNLISPACPLCFGIADWKGNHITGDITPVQLQLQLQLQLT